MNDLYVYIIIALLPLTACLLVLQVDPYHALVIRGILGAVAALVEAVLGAADVALTEALVGTMLATTLYAVAVRSSLLMRLGVIAEEQKEDSLFEKVLAELRAIVKKRYLRLELVSYTDRQSLEQALLAKEIHGTFTRQLEPTTNVEQPYQTTTRIQRLYEILQGELVSSATSLSYIRVSELGKEK